jgi:hypothetical protein
MNRFVAAACLLPAVLSGCAGSLSLGALSSQTPGTLGEVEQLKTAVVTAPLAGCVATVQQADMLLKALSTGVPAIPISSRPAPPILTTPAPTPAPAPVMPAPRPPPVPSPMPAPPSGSPIVTPTP